MTPLPKKKISKSRGRKRLAAQKYLLASLVSCPNCKKAKLPHTVCPSCGFYNGTEIVKAKEVVKVTKISPEEK